MCNENERKERVVKPKRFEEEKRKQVWELF